MTEERLQDVYQRMIQCKGGYGKFVSAKCYSCKRSSNLLFPKGYRVDRVKPDFWECAGCHFHNRIDHFTLRSNPLLYPHYGPLGNVIKMAEKMYLANKI